MYARITPYKMKPGSKRAAVKIMEGLKSRISALPGQHRFINAINDTDGSGYIVSLTEVAESSPATFEVVANWESANVH